MRQLERVYPPFFGGRRKAKVDTALGGFLVPAGYAVIYSTFAANRDPKAFEEADKFRPERWLDKVTPMTSTFGMGTRSEWGGGGERRGERETFELNPVSLHFKCALACMWRG